MSSCEYADPRLDYLSPKWKDKRDYGLYADAMMEPDWEVGELLKTSSITSTPWRNRLSASLGRRRTVFARRAASRCYLPTHRMCSLGPWSAAPCGAMYPRLIWLSATARRIRRRS